MSPRAKSPPACIALVHTGRDGAASNSLTIAAWKLYLHRAAQGGEMMDQPVTIGARARITGVPAKTIGGSVLTALLVGVLLLFPPPGLAPAAMPAAVVILFAIVFWATESLAGHVTALAFFLLALMCGVSSGVVFSGFKSGGWPILTVLMTQVIGFSTILFPYQAPALVIAMERGDIPLKTGLRLVIVLAVLTLVVLTPLNYLWWQLLGYFTPSG